MTDAPVMSAHSSLLVGVRELVHRRGHIDAEAMRMAKAMSPVLRDTNFVLGPLPRLQREGPGNEG